MIADILRRAGRSETDDHKDVRPGCRIVGDVRDRNCARVMWPGLGKGE